MLGRIIATLAVVLMAQAAAAQVKVRVISPPGDVNLPLWIAEEQGFFEDGDLAVAITHSADAVRRLEELVEKRHEIALATLDDVVGFNDRIAKSPSPHATSYALVSISGGMLRPVTAPLIASLGELKGRRIAVDRLGSAEADIWKTLLGVAGVPEGAYAFVVSGSEDERVEALRRGLADAALLMPAAAARAGTLGMRVLAPFSESIGASTWHVGVINATWVNRDEAVRAFAQACVRAMDWLYEPRNRPAVAAILRKRIPGLDEAQSIAAVEWATAGRHGYSRGCAFERAASMGALYRAEIRWGTTTASPAGAPRPPPHLRRDPIAWSIAEEARRTTPAAGTRDGSMAAYAVAEPLLDVMKPDGNFAKAERALDRALQSRAQMSDGTWVLQTMYEGFRTNVGWIGSWETAGTRLAAWRAAHPDSIHARLAQAWYLVAEAWRARGDAAASQVPAAAWEKFRSYMGQARAVLDEIGPRAQGNPVWHWAMLHVAFAQGATQESRLAMLAEATRREPTFVAHYTEYARGLTPRWGGSTDAFRAFANATVKRTSAAQGRSMYARLYPLLINVEHDREPFEELGVPWPDLRAGFEDWLARHPADSVAHLFASYACRAGDGRTFLALRPKLRPREFPVAGAYTWDHCSQAFLKPA